MQTLQRGQRLTLPNPRLQLRLSGAAALGLFVAFDARNQPITLETAEQPPGKLVRRLPSGEYGLDLSQLPPEVESVSLLHGGGPESGVTVGDGSDSYRFDTPADRQSGTMTRLTEFYRRGGQWKLYAAAENVGTLEQLHPALPGLLVQAKAAPITPPATPPAVRPPNSSLNFDRPRSVSVGPAGPPAPSTPLTLNKQATQAKLLSLAKDQAPGMVPLIEQARLTLEKRGLDALTFEVKLVLDVSASMTNLFQSGQVQRLVERSLALAARLDDNGEVEVTLFGTRARSGGTVLLGNIGSFVQQMHFQYDGGTRYAPAIREMITQQAQAAHPLLVLFITDGEAGDIREATQAIKDASHLPIFFKFLALDSGNESFSFLEQLDTMPGRVVDNANFARIRGLKSMPDPQLFDLLTEEIDQWLPAAKAAGVLDGRARPLGGQALGGQSPQPGPGGPGSGGGPNPPDTRPWWKKLLD
ncbi:VWA domain-containing protein [Deinococcus sp. UYEF24]